MLGLILQVFRPRLLVYRRLRRKSVEHTVKAARGRHASLCFVDERASSSRRILKQAHVKALLPEVTFDVDSNGILSVGAYDRSTRKDSRLADVGPDTK